MRTLKVRRRLFDEHAGYARSIACAMWRRGDIPHRTGCELEEFVQAALVGLWDSTRLWEKKNGATFRTHSAWRIRGAIRDHLRGHWYWRKRWDPSNKPPKGETPGTDSGKLPPMVLPMPKAGDREHPTRWNGYRQEVAKSLIRLLLARIPRREREIVRRYYLEGEHQNSIARDLGVSPSRISQILNGGTDNNGPGALELMHREATQGMAGLLCQQLEDVPERLPARTLRRSTGPHEEE